MKILLIEPPFYRLYDKNLSLDKYPLSLGYLVGMVISKTKHSVKIYNADFSPKSKSSTVTFLTGEGFNNYKKNLNDLTYSVWTEIENIIKMEKPSIIGISSKSQNFKSACIVADIAKKINKNTIIIVGGPHPTLVGEAVLEHKSFDIAVLGEGEEIFLNIIQKIDKKEPIESTDGIIYRKNNQIFKTPRHPFIEDINKLDSPYKYAPQILINYNAYPSFAFRSIFATRGCPFKCSFCGSFYIWSNKVRFRTPKNVVDEIKMLRNIGINYFNFDDDTFGVNKKYLFELCEELIKYCKGIKWSCEIHVKLVDDDVLKIMKKAGCDLIKLGIESGNNAILKAIRKNITIEEAFMLVKKSTNTKLILWLFLW